MYTTHLKVYPHQYVYSISYVTASAKTLHVSIIILYSFTQVNVEHP